VSFFAFFIYPFSHQIGTHSSMEITARDRLLTTS